MTISLTTDKSLILSAALTSYKQPTAVFSVQLISVSPVNDYAGIEFAPINACSSMLLELRKNNISSLDMLLKRSM